MITTECQEYLTEGTLRHGLHVAVRPLCRDDRLEVVEGFAHISAESRLWMAEPVGGASFPQLPRAETEIERMASGKAS